MIGIRDFIVKIPNKYTDTFKTESGLVFYGDRRWLKKEMANTLVECVETPLEYNGPVKKGFTVLIDATVIFSQVYEKTGEAESQNLIDRENMLFKIQPNMVIAYLNNEDELIGCHGNILCRRIEMPKKDKSDFGLIIIPENVNKKYDENRFSIAINSSELKDLNIEIGDTIRLFRNRFIDVFVEGKKMQWVRLKDIIAKELV